MNACDHDGEAAREDDDVEDVPSFVQYGTFAARYLERLLASDRAGAALVIEDALAAGVSVRDIYLTILQPTQYEIGRLWELDRVSVADEHFCTGVSQLVMARLYTSWIKPPLPNAPRASVAP